MDWTNYPEIKEVATPRDDDNAEVAEIRAWLRRQPPSEFWGLTPATRIAWLLKRIDSHLEGMRAFRLNL